MTFEEYLVAWIGRVVFSNLQLSHQLDQARQRIQELEASRQPKDP